MQSGEPTTRLLIDLPRQANRPGRRFLRSPSALRHTAVRLTTYETHLAVRPCRRAGGSHSLTPVRPEPRRWPLERRRPRRSIELPTTRGVQPARVRPTPPLALTLSGPNSGLALRAPPDPRPRTRATDLGVARASARAVTRGHAVGA